MTIGGRSLAQTAAQATFTFEGRSLTAERIQRRWKLSFEGCVVESRDLSAGIDKLLGRSNRNVTLVLRILEWEAASR
jgi:hypothetical protein